jgi:hypothetical protein
MLKLEALTPTSHQIPVKAHIEERLMSLILPVVGATVRYKAAYKGLISRDPFVENCCGSWKSFKHTRSIQNLNVEYAREVWLPLFKLV